MKLLAFLLSFLQVPLIVIEMDPKSYPKIIVTHSTSVTLCIVPGCSVYFYCHDVKFVWNINSFASFFRPFYGFIVA